MDKSASRIQHMFSEIAPSYDKVNTYLSLGIHHLWKNKLVRLSEVGINQQVLDCATGTGDLAILYKKQVGPNGKVVATDFCKNMVALGPAKAKKHNLDISFQVADASQLPFADQHFHCTSMSFGIRNVENRTKALQEMTRVTQSGGKVMILEFGQPSLPMVSQAYELYSKKLLPKIGGWISGNPEAYQYLNDSSQVFPCGQDFANEIQNIKGIKKVEFWPLSMGVAYIYRCFVQ